MDALEIPEQGIMSTMGHVSKQMRERYSHATESAKHDAMKFSKLPSLRPPGEVAEEVAKVETLSKTGKTVTH